MYETPQGLYGTVWQPQGHGLAYITTETSEPIYIESGLNPLDQILTVEQDAPNIWTII